MVLLTSLHIFVFAIWELCARIKEMCTFFSKTIVKRTQPGQRQSVQHEGENGALRNALQEVSRVLCTTSLVARTDSQLLSRVNDVCRFFRFFKQRNNLCTRDSRIHVLQPVDVPRVEMASQYRTPYDSTVLKALYEVQTEKRQGQ